MNLSYIPIDERETIVNYDYCSKRVNIYTTRSATIKRLTKILGKGLESYDADGKIYSVEWNITFKNRDLIRKSISLSNLLPFDYE